MKNCNFCNEILTKKEIEDNWAFNQRGYCSRTCAKKNRRNLNLKYKTRIDKGKKRNYINYKKYNLGKKTKELWKSTEYREHMKEAHKGIKQSKETIEKRVSKFKGIKHHNWKGGITPINDKIRKSFKYKLWRRKIFERDEYTCKWCKNKSGNGKAIILHADHIKPFALFPELRFDIDNGRTLCKDCHITTKTYGRPKLNG